MNGEKVSQFAWGVLEFIRNNPGCVLDQSQKNSAQVLIRAGLIRRDGDYRSTYVAL